MHIFFPKFLKCLYLVLSYNFIQYSYFKKDKVIFIVNRLSAKWLFSCKSRYVSGKYLLGFPVGLSPIPVCSYMQHCNWVIYIEKVRNELLSSEVAPLSLFIIYFFYPFLLWLVWLEKTLGGP